MYCLEEKNWVNKDYVNKKLKTIHDTSAVNNYELV